MSISLDDIHIRTDLQSGDLGYIVYLHGKLYSKEYGYGLPFESFVAGSISEFYNGYQPENNRTWICEHQGQIIGSLFLMNRDDAAQLRYFLIEPEYRGIGLGKKLMDLFMEFLKQCQYKKCFLTTTHELPTAAHLYKRYGFKLVEEQASDAFGKMLHDQRYELIL